MKVSTTNANFRAHKSQCTNILANDRAHESQWTNPCNCKSSRKSVQPTYE